LSGGNMTMTAAIIAIAIIIVRIIAIRDFND